MGSQVLIFVQAIQKGKEAMAVDETVLKINGLICYLWAAIDVDTGEILALYASRGRGIPNAIKFLKMVLRSCDGKPIVVVDRGPWYRWALERLGITYFHETFGNRNKIERRFRELKNRTKRFYSNVNSKTLKSIEEIATAVAIVHNLVRIRRGGGNTNLTVSSLRRTSLKTSELKVVKLFHLSGRPRSWILYNFLNFAYLLLPHSKTLVYRNPPRRRLPYVEDVSSTISIAP